MRTFSPRGSIDVANTHPASLKLKPDQTCPRRELLSTLGHPMFIRFDSATTSNTDHDEIFYCNGSSADGRGRLTSEGFVVLAGSSGRKDVVDSVVGHRDERRRKELVENGICRVEG